jgi:hypothetical protein
MSTEDEVRELRERVGQLEYQLSLFASLTAQTLSGRWTGEDTNGELPHAAAELVALLGGPDAADRLGFQPRSFNHG